MHAVLAVSVSLIDVHAVQDMFVELSEMHAALALSSSLGVDTRAAVGA